jgi:hypothetical protein
MRRLPLVLAVSAACAALPASAQGNDALLAEVRRLADRVEALERQNRDMEKALASERLSEREPEVITRLKAVEFQTLSMQKQARQIEALEGVSVGGSLTAVVQQANRAGAAAGQDSRANYRGDISVTLPGGDMGDIESRLFAHLRFGQGTGVALKPTYTSTVNTTAFEVGGTPADDSFAILAQAWYQIKVPLPRDGVKAQSRAHLHLTVGKIDPFVFFDQNTVADDESSRFMNNVFVHNPLLDSGGDVGADAYGFAPGAILQYGNERNKGSEWLLSLGVFGAGPGANFSGSLAGPLLIAQAETSARVNFLPGSYRAYLWSKGRGVGYDTVERRHLGMGVSADQKVSDDLTLFGRYGHQLKGKVQFDRALTLGAELAGHAWGRAADSLGFAAGALRTSATFQNDSAALDANGDGTPDFGYQAGGWENQFELYYRYRVNAKFDLTPDFQLIRRPAGNDSGESIKLIGLRAKIGI